MRILFLSHYFPPEVNAPASRTFEHCRAWVRSGHEAFVVTNVPNHPAGKIYPGYRNALAQSETVADIKVYRLLTLLAANRGIVRRSFSYFFYLVMSVLAAPFLPRVDVVVSTSPQFFCGLAGYFVSRINRVPWVLEIRDLWPESIMAVGAVSRSFTLRWLVWLANFAYRKADRVLCVTDSFKAAIMAEGIPGEKIEVIKNGVDLEFFSPERSLGPEAGRIPGLENTQGKFVLSYVGTHGMAHGLDTVLKAAELLRDEPDVLFLLVGDGAERGNLLKQRDIMRLDNVVFLDQQPKTRMPAVWAVTDVSLVVLKDQPLFRTVIPSKIFESMAMMKPVILGVRGESESLLEESGAGICIPPESPAQLARAVRRLYTDPDERRNMGLAGRSFVEQNFDRKVLAARYVELLGSVVAGRPGASASAASGTRG
ncbi:MAG: glycosyltransferase family 4 protein [Gammaproteobacteria bacterium]|nr:glycosyltransferase family 4 protein [Gammaproteobacteria bacterium]